MKQNFTEWLSKRDKELVNQISNEGFLDMIRKRPAISKALSMGVLGGALGHGLEAAPGMGHGHGHETGHHAPIDPHGAPPDDHHGPAPKPYGGAPNTHGAPSSHGPTPSGHGAPPPSHEQHRQHAEIELLFHFVGESTRRELEAIARKWNKSPSDPNFKRWLLRMFKKFANVRSTLSVENLKELPATIGKTFLGLVDREMKHVQHVFSELPDIEPDYDVELHKRLLATGDRFSSDTVDPGSETPDSTPLPMNRSAYRHRKQHRSGY